MVVRESFVGTRSVSLVSVSLLLIGWERGFSVSVARKLAFWWERRRLARPFVELHREHKTAQCCNTRPTFLMEDYGKG